SMAAWRVTEPHRPLGSIMRSRKEVYRQSSILRHQTNKQERKEPKNLAEVFGEQRAAARQALCTLAWIGKRPSLTLRKELTAMQTETRKATTQTQKTTT